MKVTESAHHPHSCLRQPAWGHWPAQRSVGCPGRSLHPRLRTGPAEAASAATLPAETAASQHFPGSCTPRNTSVTFASTAELCSNTSYSMLMLSRAWHAGCHVPATRLQWSPVRISGLGSPMWCKQAVYQSRTHSGSPGSVGTPQAWNTNCYTAHALLSHFETQGVLTLHKLETPTVTLLTLCSLTLKPKGVLTFHKLGTSTVTLFTPCCLTLKPKGVKAQHRLTIAPPAPCCLTLKLGECWRYPQHGRLHHWHLAVLLWSQGSGDTPQAWTVIPLTPCCLTLKPRECWHY